MDREQLRLQPLTCITLPSSRTLSPSLNSMDPYWSLPSSSIFHHHHLSLVDIFLVTIVQLWWTSLSPPSFCIGELLYTNFLATIILLWWTSLADLLHHYIAGIRGGLSSLPDCHSGGLTSLNTIWLAVIILITLISVVDIPFHHHTLSLLDWNIFLITLIVVVIPLHHHTLEFTGLEHLPHHTHFCSGHFFPSSYLSGGRL